MSGSGLTGSGRPSSFSVGSCNYSVLVARLSVSCFLFLCVVLLLQVYEHRTASQFHVRNIRVQISTSSLSLNTLVVLNESNDTVRHLKIHSITHEKTGHPLPEKIKYKVIQEHKPLPTPEMNATHIAGILMEPVSAQYLAQYSRNIYFTVKTTHKYHSERLFPLMLTWLQAVDRNKVISTNHPRTDLISPVVSIITDKSPSAEGHVDVMRKAGFSVIDSNCSSGCSNIDLCCKQGVEFSAYYNALESHPEKEYDYQWYCHVDDDMYVNVPQLSQFLQQYDPHKPYYFGRRPSIQHRRESNIKLSNRTAYHMSHEANHTLQQMAFQYATGAAFCISNSLMMEAKKFFNGPNTYHETYTLAHLPGDMTVGFTIGILLGYNLTEVNDMKNQFDNISTASLKDLNNYLTVSSSIAFVESLKQFGSSMNVPKQGDTKRTFLLYHCLLYPTVSWCQDNKK